MWSLFRFQKRIEDKKKILEDLCSEKSNLTRKIQLIRSDNLDLDLLDERVRTLLCYAQKDEIVILDEELQ
jgi:cell division protein FtsB